MSRAAYFDFPDIIEDIMQSLLLLLIAAAFTFGRLYVPTVGHSWSMVFIAAAHIFVGVLLTWLWQCRGRWPLGWICLLVLLCSRRRCSSLSMVDRAMSKAALMADIQAFVGQPTNDCIERIKASAERNRFAVEVHDPEINTNDIDREERRLDVFQDADGKIVSFGTG